MAVSPAVEARRLSIRRGAACEQAGSYCPAAANPVFRKLRRFRGLLITFASFFMVLLLYKGLNRNFEYELRPAGNVLPDHPKCNRQPARSLAGPLNRAALPRLSAVYKGLSFEYHRVCLYLVPVLLALVPFILCAQLAHKVGTLCRPKKRDVEANQRP